MSLYSYTSELSFFAKEISTNATVGVAIGSTRGIAVSVICFLGGGYLHILLYGSQVTIHG